MNLDEIEFLRRYQRTAGLLTEKSVAKSDRRRFKLKIGYSQAKRIAINYDGFSEDEEHSFLTTFRQFLAEKDVSLYRACNLIEREYNLPKHKTVAREARRIWRETLKAPTGVHIVTKKMDLNDAPALSVGEAFNIYFNSYVFHSDLDGDVNWESIAPESRAILKMRMQVHSHQLLICIKTVDDILEDWLGSYS